MTKAQETHAPIRQSVHVKCPIEEAFRLFTEKFAEWSPLADDSCEIEPWPGGKVFERTRSGEEHKWGEVIAWNPPEYLEFTWHPGKRGDRDQTVRIEFNAEADGTRVTLIHTGWQLTGVAICLAQAA